MGSFYGRAGSFLLNNIFLKIHFSSGYISDCTGKVLKGINENRRVLKIYRCIVRGCALRAVFDRFFNRARNEMMICEPKIARHEDASAGGIGVAGRLEIAWHIIAKH